MSQRHARIELFTTLIYRYIVDKKGASLDEVNKNFPLIPKHYVFAVLLNLKNSLKIYAANTPDGLIYFANELPF